jgi:hypothetical protein
LIERFIPSGGGGGGGGGGGHCDGEGYTRVIMYMYI